MVEHRLNFRWRALSAVCLLASATVSAQVGIARADELDRAPVAVVLPLIVGWFDGKPAPYITTEASDPDVAKKMNANYVARLGDAANTGAVDDIYTISNFAQSNIIPSRPKPAGPRNKDLNYTPLWQVSAVTWNDGVIPILLTSEAAVLAAVSSGQATLVKTNIVVNCPVIFTASGGLLPGAELVEHRPE